MSECNESASIRSVMESSARKNKQDLLETPFSLEWMFGRNVRLPILNLTKQGKNIIFFFASGHSACIYCIEEKCLVPLLSHLHEIITLDSDRARRFLITADTKTSINVWDTNVSDKPLVIHTITSPFEQDGIRAAALSPDAKYLIAGSGKRKCCIKIWLWSYGRDAPDGTVNLPSRFGMIKRLRFCQEFAFSHYFVAVFINGICFGEWDHNLGKLKVHIAERSFMNCIIDAMYIPKTRRVVSITDHGQVILWSDVVPDDDETDICNDKEYVKVVKVSGVALTAIECVDGVILIGDEMGELRFYNKDLKLLYYSSNFDVEGAQIQCIAANVMERDYKILETMNFDNCPLDDDDLQKEILYAPLIPRDFSTEEKPLIIRDFLMTTSDGKVLSVDFMEGMMKEIFYRTMEEILTMDFHPLKNILCVFSKSGCMMQYDPDTKEQLLYTKLELGMSDRLKTKEEVAGSKLLEGKNDKRPDSGVDSNTFQYHYPVQSVTCVKFAKNGIHLMIGTDRGCIYTLDPDVLTSYSTEPYRFTTEPITHMTFSDDSRFFIYSDATNRVILLYFGVRKWALIGKNRFHHKSMVDFVAFRMLSTDFSRILSVGEDQLLVEYDLDQSITQGRLDIISSYRYDQSAVPSSVSYIPPSLLQKLGINTLEYDSVLLITDQEMKMKLVDCNTGSILYTFLGPVFGAAIKHSIFFTKEEMDFVVFSAGNKLGMYLLPIDGNPFRSIGVVASPYPVEKICLSHDHIRIITSGIGDQSISLWKIHELAATSHFISGGSGLEPYCSLLPGGKNGYLFQELLDMFYYIQILASGLNTIEERCVNEFIHITEIVDFMRSVGFFPTDFQTKNMLREMELQGADHITFKQLVKLYLNHKPVMGTRSHKIEKALLYFIRKFVEESGGSWRSGKYPKTISRKNVVRILTDFAETVDRKQAAMCLKELWYQKEEGDDVGEGLDEQEILKKLPEKVDFNIFIDNLLGIGINETKPK